ncbi:hypothetical protein JCM11251_002941 [Rhodosporidiobolus azoricus]
MSSDFPHHAASSATRSTLSRSTSPSGAPLPRARTVLPPLSSLSLPGTPALPAPSSLPDPSPPLDGLHHPRPTYPPRRTSEQLSFLDNTASPPSSSSGMIPASTSRPDPEVYARAYALLRSKLLGPPSSTSLAPSAVDLRKVADAASAALREKVQEREKELADTEGQTRKRRSRSWEESVLHDSEEDEDKPEGLSTSTTKKARKTCPNDKDDAGVAFFDNAAPCFCPSSTRSAGEVQRPTRPRSSSPSVLRLLAQPPSQPTTSSSSSSPHLSLLSRNRSVSLPSPALPHPSHTHTGRYPNPTLSFSSRSTSHGHLSAAAAMPSGLVGPAGAGGNQARHEALLSVVQSFERVRACRAEGWRRLAERGVAGGLQHY